MHGASDVQFDRARVFCIMPFSEPWSDIVWTTIIEPAVIRAGLRPARGDTTLRTGNLIDNVWTEILASGCVIADLSAANPNVYYELGMTRALGRDAFVLIQRGMNLPADLKGAHYLEYDAARPDDATYELAEKLAAWKVHEDIMVDGVESLFSRP